MPEVGVVNHLRMRIVHNLVEFPPPLIALYPPLIPDLSLQLLEPQKLWVDFMAIYNFLRKSNNPRSKERHDFKRYMHGWNSFCLYFRQNI